MSSIAAGKGYVDVDYLDEVTRLSRARKRSTDSCLALKAGNWVLDVGSGPGDDALALAALVGESGRVFGADHDADMVATANQRAIDAGLARRVTFVCAEASSLPWPDATFDAVRSERMLQHVLDYRAAFAEMVRVAKPGATILVMDGEWSTFTVDSSEAEIERRLMRYHTEHMINNPHSGRSLRRQFREAGLVDVSVDVWPVLVTDYTEARQILRLDLLTEQALGRGVVTAEEAARWRHSLERAAAIDGFFASTNGVTVVGRKPE
jgi:ubiquinone/menaquinone biosynthesis C-methylase UbiE